MSRYRITESSLRNMVREAVEDLMKGNPLHKDPLADYQKPSPEELKELCVRTFEQMSGIEVFNFLNRHNLIPDIEKVGYYLRDFYYKN